MGEIVDRRSGAELRKTRLGWLKQQSKNHANRRTGARKAAAARVAKADVAVKDEKAAVGADLVEDAKVGVRTEAMTAAVAEIAAVSRALRKLTWTS